MIRLLMILVAAVLIAAGFAWIADRHGELLFTIDNYEVRTSAAAAIILAILFAAFIGFATRVVAAILSAPGALGDWSASRRARRGNEALSRGLVAAAAGDSYEARKQAEKARRLLGAPPLALLLTAQASQLEGDEEGQISAYRAMLDHPDTEFLGLRGLFMQAMRNENIDEAMKLASRAHALKPRALWATNALFDLRSAQRDWTGAKAVLDSAAKAKIMDGGLLRRRRAVLLAAEALDAEGRGDSERALSMALEALSLSPGLAPAAVLAAKKLAAQNRAWRAQDIIEAAWTQSPHPDLATAYAAIKSDEDRLAHAKRMLGLAHLNRDHFESRMLAAEQAVALKQWPEARRVLAPLARGFASTRVCALMAEIEEGEHGDATAAHGWLMRAVKAPRDAEWRCAHCGWSSPRWLAVCGHCGAFDTLAWSAPGPDAVEKISAAPADEGLAGDVNVDLLKEMKPEKPKEAGPQPAHQTRLREQRAAQGHKDEGLIILPRPPDDPGPVDDEFAPGWAKEGEVR